MAELDKQGTVSLEELMVSTLAMTDALAAPDRKRLDLESAEFRSKLTEERSTYQAILKRLH